MAKEFTLPDPGEGIHEAEIISVEVAAGDRVTEGDILFVIETDKAEVDVPSPFSGTVEDIGVQAGDDVRVGDVLLTFSTEDDSSNDSDARDDEHPQRASDSDGEDAEDRRKPSTDDTAPPEQEASVHSQEEHDSPQPEDDTPPDRDGDDSHARSEPVPAAPSTRRLARELDVDLQTVDGSGHEGRITDDDVRAAAGEGQQRPRESNEETETESLPPSRWPLTPRQAELPDFEKWGEVERIELRSVRRATAQRMALAWSQIPHVTHEDLADITELEQRRRELASELKERDVRLTLTTLVIKAVVAALKEFPLFNASLDPDAGEIVLKHYYNIGVAVATDRGLLVPVLREADRKNVIEVASELARLADRARDGNLDLEEMRGGTFSITNPGGIGGTAFTPIVNFPQVAILGCARARLEPVASGDIGSAQVSHRFRLPLCLAFDHRVNDGADAARFVNLVRELLEDPGSFTLAV
jgi:pyruvate dehydrogenase E2 component (dihydrolipoamide acetyltransferase)